jgi:hypothetical protein
LFLTHRITEYPISQQPTFYGSQEDYIVAINDIHEPVMMVTENHA